ncbi:hypothetical protein JCM8547_008601 [Rhodosporidiobolus lusitaniae]
MATSPPYTRIDSSASTLVNGGSDGDSDSYHDLEEEKTSFAAADSTSAQHYLRRLAKAQNRRQLQYFLVLLGVSLLTFFRSGSFSLLPGSSSSSSSLTTPTVLPPYLVGPRPLTAPSGQPLYTSCSSAAFLRALSGAKIREDGRSRTIDQSVVTNVDVPPLEFSFDFPWKEEEGGEGCELPRVWTKEEACELMSAFGGLYVLGDSYSRHILTALLIILHGRLDGAVNNFDTTDDCRGEHMFMDNKSCRTRVGHDTTLEPAPPVCGGKVEFKRMERWQVAGAFTNDTDDLVLFRGRLPASSQQKSTVYLQSYGIHFNYHFPSVIPWLNAYKTYSDSKAIPRPISLTVGPHHPPANQYPQYIPSQGPIPTGNFNDAMRHWADEHGSFTYVDILSATNGSASPDGTHLAYQANMEKAMITLTLLDMQWAEIVKNGGMVELAA